MIHLDKLSADEAERLAYAEGYTGTAALFARIEQLEVERDLLLRKVEHLTAQVDALTAELWHIESNHIEPDKDDQ